MLWWENSHSCVFVNTWQGHILILPPSRVEEFQVRTKVLTYTWSSSVGRWSIHEIWFFWIVGGYKLWVIQLCVAYCQTPKPFQIVEYFLETWYYHYLWTGKFYDMESSADFCSKSWSKWCYVLLASINCKRPLSSPHAISLHSHWWVITLQAFWWALIWQHIWQLLMEEATMFWLKTGIGSSKLTCSLHRQRFHQVHTKILEEYDDRRCGIAWLFLEKVVACLYRTERDGPNQPECRAQACIQYTFRAWVGCNRNNCSWWLGKNTSAIGLWHASFSPVRNRNLK